MDIIQFEQLPEVIALEHRNEYAYNLYLIAVQNLSELESTMRLNHIQMAKANRMMSVIENKNDEDYLHWAESYNAAQSAVEILAERIVLARQSKKAVMDSIDSLGGLDVVRSAALHNLDSKIHKMFGV